jgi:hypothetical protein
LKGRLYTGPVSREFAEGGWHLLGNPYPSAIDWARSDGWVRSNFRETIWYRTQIGTEMVFVTYNRYDNLSSHAPEDIDPSYTKADKLSVIPAYQSVWIRTISNAPGNVTLDNGARLHVAEYYDENGVIIDTGDTTPQLKSSSINTQENIVRIVASNQYTRDAALVYFSDNNTDDFGTEDSEKYFNSSVRVPEIYTKVGDNSLVINGMSQLSDSYKEVPLSVRNRDVETVTLTFDLRRFNSNHSIVLLDYDTGESLPLTNGSEYSYVPGSGDRHDRFVLIFTPAITTDIEDVISGENPEPSIRIKSYGGKVLVSADMSLLQRGPGAVEIFTVEGRKVGHAVASSGRTMLFLPRESGVYVIRASFGKVVKTERVVFEGDFGSGI